MTAAPKRLLVGLVFLTFFVISFLTNILGALVPDIIAGFHVSLTLAAVLPMTRASSASKSAKLTD